MPDGRGVFTDPSPRADSVDAMRATAPSLVLAASVSLGTLTGSAADPGPRPSVLDLTLGAGRVITQVVEAAESGSPVAGRTTVTQSGGSVDLTVVPAAADADDVRTTFREADVAVADGGRQGVLTGAIPSRRDFTGSSETRFGRQVRPGDGRVLTSPSTAEIPFQQVDLPVATIDDQQVVWRGRVDPAREAVLRAWNGTAWEELARARGTVEGQLELRADLWSRHRHGDVVPVLITGEDPFADDLPNQIRDEFERPNDYDFSIAHLTDTQYLSEGAIEKDTARERKVWRQAYTRTTEWIAANADLRKIAFVAHTGDVIEDWHNVGSDEAHARDEFRFAAGAQRKIEDAGIVNAVIPGNHDNLYGTDTGPGALFNDYFGPERFAAQAASAAWQEQQATYQPWRAGDNSNSYVLFTRGNLDFVVVSLGFGVTPDEVAWADGVLKQFGDRNAIVLTHAYQAPGVNTDGRGGGFTFDGQAVLDGVIAQNPNVALVLSGHEHGVTINLRRDVARTGHDVLELLADYQFYKVESDEVGLTDVGYHQNTPLLLGSSFFRLLQFDVDAGEVAVDTFSPLLQDFGATEYDDRHRYDGSEDDTRLPINLTTRTTSLSTDGVVLLDPKERVIGEQTAGAGRPVEASWAGLTPGDLRGWIATSVDAQSGDRVDSSGPRLLTVGSAPRSPDTPSVDVPAAEALALASDFSSVAGVESDADLVVGGTVDTAHAGTYPLTYEATDDAGNQTTVRRLVTVKPAPAPQNTERPEVIGALRVGSVLRGSRGTWKHLATTRFTAQWLRDGTPIPGATGGDYRLVAADLGHDVSFRITGTTNGHPPVAVTSEADRVGKAMPKVQATASTVEPGERSTLRVGVAALAPTDGVVRVTVDGRVVGEGRVSEGRAVVRLPELRAGIHGVRVSYLGNRVVGPKSSTATVEVSDQVVE